jgi:basic membrane protein A
MKGRLWIYLIFSITIGLLFSFGALEFTRAQASIEAGPSSPQETETIAVGFVPNEIGIGDLGFNWLSYQGLLRAESELGVTGTVYTTTSSADYEPFLQQCADDGNDLCIAVGFEFSDAIQNVAILEPEIKFGIIDVSYDIYPINLRGMVFATEQVGYLAGTLAGLMSESNVIGSIGGMDIPPVTTFIDGYTNGAQCVDPEVNVLIEYANNFGDPDLGASIAQDMIALGADVIFPVAGGTGFGALLTTTQSGFWGIGVDTDQYITLFDDGSVDGADKMLTSAMKRMDNAVFDTISDVISDTFTSGTELYDLAVDGVALAPFHEAEAEIPLSVQNMLFSIEQRIIKGTIDVNGYCGSMIYLPMISH